MDICMHLPTCPFVCVCACICKCVCVPYITVRWRAVNLKYFRIESNWNGNCSNFAYHFAVCILCKVARAEFTECVYHVTVWLNNDFTEILFNCFHFHRASSSLLPALLNCIEIPFLFKMTDDAVFHKLIERVQARERETEEGREGNNEIWISFSAHCPSYLALISV